MSVKLLSIVASPIISYFDATIGLVCSSWSPKDDFHHETELSKKALETKESQEQRYSYRPRKTSFSLFLCIQKQREMASPKRLEDDRSWIEEELILASAQRRNSNLLQ